MIYAGSGGHNQEDPPVDACTIFEMQTGMVDRGAEYAAFLECCLACFERTSVLVSLAAVSRGSRSIRMRPRCCYRRSPASKRSVQTSRAT
jgi:hypothetical protein